MRREFNVLQDISMALMEAERNEPVTPYLPIDELKAKLDLSLENKGIEDERLFEVLKELVLSTPRTSSKMFFNQLFGGRRNAAVLGEMLTIMLNNSMYTYKVGGPQIEVEKEVIRRMIGLLGFGETANGTFAAGGSMCNLMSMIMARDTFNRDIRFEGVQNKMTVYTSEECHYSIAKNAAFCGIGRNHVRKVRTDERGRMSVEDLALKIKTDIAAGYHPFMVNATGGTTVICAFDPIDEIANICEKYDLWLHVDGAYCGSVIFSEKYKHLLKGIERADSYCVSAHKMLGVPLSCAMIIVQDGEQLHHSFSSDASYLYQTSDDDYNLGKISLQCGRRNDALKLWTLWKSLGTQGMAALVEHQFYLADVAREYIKSNSEYTLYNFENSVSVCFNYKDIPATDLCTQLYAEGQIMVGYGSFREQEFVRLVTINPDNTKNDILAFFEKLEQFVEEKMTLKSS